MTSDEIDTMWQQATYVYNEKQTRYYFAKLVAAAEREACAKVAEKTLRGYTQAVTGVAEAIRARGNG